MSTNTDFDKIDKVLSKITGKELKSFVRIYSYTHDDFATALVEKYWKPERGNYKEMVEACLAWVSGSMKLLIQGDEIEEDSRLGMLGDIVKRMR